MKMTLRLALAAACAVAVTDCYSSPGDSLEEKLEPITGTLGFTPEREFAMCDPGPCATSYDVRVSINQLLCDGGLSGWPDLELGFGPLEGRVQPGDYTVSSDGGGSNPNLLVAIFYSADPKSRPVPQGWEASSGSGQLLTLTQSTGMGPRASGNFDLVFTAPDGGRATLAGTFDTGLAVCAAH